MSSTGPSSPSVENTLRRAYQLLEAHGAPVEALAMLTSAVESLSDDGSVASILMLDREGLLRNAASPGLPADYLDSIDRLAPHPDLGTCAAAAATGEMVLTPDFQDDSKWAELKHLPLAIGFRGAWSMPIKNAYGRVLGTFGTYFRRNRVPTQREIDIVAAFAPAAALAIEAMATRR